MKCPICGTWAEDGFSFCDHCGAPLAPVPRPIRTQPPAGTRPPAYAPVTVPVVPARKSGGQVFAWILVAVLAVLSVVLGILVYRQRDPRRAGEVIPAAAPPAPAASLPEEAGSTDQEEAPVEIIVESAPSDMGGESAPAEVTEAPAPEPAVNVPQPFYGVWVYASVDQADAESVANQVRAFGVDAKVIHTPDWSNLNQKSYYAVTIGTYATQKEAEAMLPKVKAYASDAYVKYSGTWQGG